MASSKMAEEEEEPAHFATTDEEEDKDSVDKDATALAMRPCTPILTPTPTATAAGRVGQGRALARAGQAGRQNRPSRRRLRRRCP